MGTERRGGEAHGRWSGRKGRTHFGGHVSVEDWPRKCHFQPPVSRKPPLQNASCAVPDNLGVLALPSLLTAGVKGHWQQFFFFFYPL